MTIAVDIRFHLEINNPDNSDEIGDYKKNIKFITNNLLNRGYQVFEVDVTRNDYDFKNYPINLLIVSDKTIGQIKKDFLGAASAVFLQYASILNIYNKCAIEI